MTVENEHEQVTAPDRRLRVVAGADQDAAKVIELLDNATICVQLPSGDVPWRHQLLAICLVDLLGRLFPRLDIRCDDDVPAHADLPPGPALLTVRLAEAARNGGLEERDPRAPEVTVCVGDAPDHSDGDPGVVLHVDGGGWVSFNGTQGSHLQESDRSRLPVGPLAAACRAAAQAANLVLGTVEVRDIPPSVYASALTHTWDSTPLAEEASIDAAPELDAVLVGAGSIGGAAAYTFANTPGLAGSLVVTDPEHLEDKNLDRALLATAAVAAAQPFKVDVVMDALSHHTGLDVTARPKTLQDWVASRPRDATLPLVLSAVDSRASRRSIQDCLPLELLNAACNSTEIHLSGHRTGHGPCVCCLHMEEVLDERAVRSRLLQVATGLNERMIVEYLVRDVPLSVAVLASIEKHRGLPVGSLARYEGRTLEQLRREELLYGATAVQTPTGTVAVAAPYITSLAGVLLAGEALKSALPGLQQFQLGPTRPHVKYAENPLQGAGRALLTSPPRWPSSECLCRSSRRLRLLRQRYGLDAGYGTDQYP